MEKPGDPSAAHAIGRRIAELRRSRKMTQATLAAAASIDRTALSKVETGQRRLGSLELARITQKLQVPWERIVEGPPRTGPDTVGAIRSQREAILEICRRYGASEPRLFGSAPRGDSTPDSDIDIDLLVEMEPGRSLLEQAGLLVELRELLGRDVDVVTEAGLAATHPGAGYERGHRPLRSDRERLMDIAEAIGRILKYTSRGRTEFESQELIQTWVLRHLEIIGATAGRLSPELRTAHPEVPWPALVAMRNVLAHDYFGIDVERAWATVERDLPPLRVTVEHLIAEISAP